MLVDDEEFGFQALAKCRQPCWPGDHWHGVAVGTFTVLVHTNNRRDGLLGWDRRRMVR